MGTVLPILGQEGPLKFIREAETQRHSFPPTVVFAFIYSELIFTGNGNLGLFFFFLFWILKMCLSEPDTKPAAPVSS